MGVAQITGTGRYCDDTAGYRYRQKKCYRHTPTFDNNIINNECD